MSIKRFAVRTLTAVAAATALAAVTPAGAQEKIKLKVIGQPLATGLIQKNKEQPFFETLAQKTGLPIEVEYKPIDTLGIKDTEQLRVMKAGLFEMASLRMSQNSRDEPTIRGVEQRVFLKTPGAQRRRAERLDQRAGGLGAFES